MGLTKMSSHHNTVALLLILHTVTCSPAKENDRPVHEIINEQARSDDIRPFIPYSNPLAGNSLQNAKLHAQNQQAMFNAERIRRHRAQIQWWNEASTKADSYMRAYHDLQENHQLELEKKQAIQEKLTSPKPILTNQETNPKVGEPKGNTDIEFNIRRIHRSQGSEKKITSTTPPPGQITEAAKHKSPNQGRKLIDKENLHDLNLETETTGDNVNRNHRSYESDHNKFSQGAVQIVPAPIYNQGVLIKPRSNIGFAYDSSPDKPYTEAITSKTQYPKQEHKYLNTQNINALKTLLNKRPQEQVNEFNALVGSQIVHSHVVEHPISQHVPENYEQFYPFNVNYANNKNNLKSNEVKEIRPVKNIVHDIPKQEAVTIRPITAPHSEHTKNYVKYDQKHVTEPISQITIEQHTVRYYGDVSTEQPHIYKPKLKLPISKLHYLDHNNYDGGVQHLLDDGVGVSAYGDDDVSIITETDKKAHNPKRNAPNIQYKKSSLNKSSKNVANTIHKLVTAVEKNYDNKYLTIVDKIRVRRSVLDSTPFLLPNDTQAPKDNTTFKAEELRLKYISSKKPHMDPDYYYNDYVDDPNPDDEYVTNFEELVRNKNQQSSYSKFNYNRPSFHSLSTSYGVPIFIYKPIQPIRYGNDLNHEYRHDYNGRLHEPMYILTQSQFEQLIRHRDLIEYLDMFQIEPRKKYPIRYRKKHGRRGLPKNVKKNINKLSALLD